MTIYDIAVEAGTSISTVSRVLNGFEYVRPETRKKILEIIYRHNYVPSGFARGLVSNSMKAIGVMTSDIRNYYFGQIAATLENLFFEWNYSTILCNTGNKSEKKKEYIHILSEKKVDGIVLVGSVFTGIEIETIIEKYLPNTPIVLANSFLALPTIHNVSIDFNSGFDLAVAHLKERGHKDILYVGTSETYNANRKLAGFYKAMEKHGLSLDGTVIRVPFGLEGGNMVDQFINSKTTAIIFADDNTAFCGARRLKEKGFRIPEDMAVIGNDNSFYSLYSDPPLTSIDTKVETFSTLVANMMHDLMEHAEVETPVLLTSDLAVREST